MSHNNNANKLYTVGNFTKLLNYAEHLNRCANGWTGAETMDVEEFPNASTKPKDDWTGRNVAHVDQYGQWIQYAYTPPALQSAAETGCVGDTSDNTFLTSYNNVTSPVQNGQNGQGAVLGSTDYRT